MDGVGEALIVVDGVVDLGAIDDDGGGVGGGVVDVDGFGLWEGNLPMQCMASRALKYRQHLYQPEWQ